MSFTQPQLPPYTITNPRTEIGREAKRKHEDAVAAIGRVREAQDINNAALQRAKEAREALLAEIGRDGYDAGKELKLAKSCHEAELLANERVASVRTRAANLARDAAVNECIGHLRTNIESLLEGEIFPLVEAAREALETAQTDSKATVPQLREAEATFQRVTTDLLGFAPYARRSDLFQLGPDGLPRAESYKVPEVEPESPLVAEVKAAPMIGVAG